MLKLIGGSVLKDIIGLIKQSPELLKKEASVRASEIQKELGSDYPRSLTTYIDSVTAEGFTSDLPNTLEVLQGQGLPSKGNPLLDALAHFISTEFGQELDALSKDFFTQSSIKKAESIRQKHLGNSHLHYMLECLLSENTYQALTHQAHEALHLLKSIPTALVQSPVELNPTLRQDIRKHFLKKYPYSFVEFQTNPQIIGGMRVFVEGAVVDHSWLAKIQAITSIKF